MEEQADNAKASNLYWKPLSWLGTIRSTSANDAFDSALWTTSSVSTTLGLEVSVLSSLPRRDNSQLAQCGCKKHCMDFHGAHTPTCTAHPGATKSHDWMVSVMGPLFRTAGHTVRTKNGVTASAGQRRCDVEIRTYLRDQAGSRSLVFDIPSRTIGLAQVATCSRTICCRIPRTSMRLRVLLRNTSSITIGNNTLTIRTFLFSPPS